MDIINSIIAALALVVSVAVLFITNRSLSLATSTTRSFLDVEIPTIEEDHQGFSAALRVTIENKGNLPAGSISVDVILRDYNAKSTDKFRLNQDVVVSSLCFPGQKMKPTRHELNPIQYQYIPGNFVVVKVIYKNDNTRKQYLTIRGFGGSRHNKDLIPQADLDSWK